MNRAGLEATSADAANAAAHWERLAADLVELADWYDAQGRPFGDTSAYRNRAKMYRLTAEALRREAATGTPHCSSCGGAHANHHHPSVAANAGCRCGQRTCPWCRHRTTGGAL